MSFESDLHGFLETDATIAAQLGGRVYPQIAPQVSEKVYATVEIVDGNPEYHAGGEAGVSTAVVTVDIFGNTYADVIAAKEAVRTRISGKRGTVGSTPVRSVFVEEDRDLDQITEFGQQYTTFAKRLSLNIAYFQTVSAPNV